MPHKVAIVGAGSIGCFVGGKLLDAGVDVILIGRARLAEQVHAHGLTCTEVDCAPVVVPPSRVRYSTDVCDVAGANLVLVCVKSGATKETANSLIPHLSAGARIASLQNGLSNAAELRAVLPGHEIIPTIVEFNVVSKERATFHCGMSGAIRLATGQEERAALFRRGGIRVSVDEDLLAHQWTKLVVNLNNAVSALSGQPTVQLITRRAYRLLLADIIAEALGVLRTAGIRPARLRGVPLWMMPPVLRLPTPLVRVVTGRQMKLDPEARSSMWEDLERRRKTEVDHLNGEIVKLAAKHGVRARLNEGIVALVKEAEEKRAGSPALSAPTLRRLLSRHGTNA